MILCNRLQERHMRTSHVGMAGMVALALLCEASCGARTELGDVAIPKDAASDATPAVPCTPGNFQLQKASPTVMFLLDSSGSMDEKFSANGDSRWQSLQSSLGIALPSVDSTMEIGALLFPSNRSNTSCSVPSAPDLSPGFGNVAPLLSLMQGTTPLGGTPTADALDVASAGLLSVRAASSARALILATDGGPNCNVSLDPSTCTCADPSQTACGQSGGPQDAQLCLDDTRTVSRIASYASQGLPTYVIGIHDVGNNQNDSVLNAMADAGGRPQAGTEHYYSATSQGDLEGALVTIRNQLGACTYLTSSVPSQDGSITVTVGSTVIPFDPTGKQGWRWGDEANGEIIFAGNACKEITSPEAGTQTVSANVACDVGDASADSSR